MNQQLKQRLGERLLNKQLLKPSELELALSEQRRVHRPLGEILVSLGFVCEADIVQLVADDLGIEYLRADQIDAEAAVVSQLDDRFVREAEAFPFQLENGVLRLVMVQPSNPGCISRVRERFPYPLEIAITTASDLSQLLQVYLCRVDAVRGLFSAIDSGEDQRADRMPIERLTQAILEDAVHRRATDIHIEPEAHVTRLRYRIDGMLIAGEGLPMDSTPAVISRIKVLCGLDISERRRPQDGHFQLNIDQRAIDFRVSLLPCDAGENAVLRVLDTQGVAMRLGNLGIAEEHQRLLSSVATRSHGIFLVTGPTGSGKTTTLYSLLGLIDATRRKVATIEDPIEIQLPLVRQSQVDPAIGFDFQTGLRALLRQDPDVILIGEIRDFETAKMAVRAAMTGHLVLATLHTNSCLGAVVRMQELGIEPFLIEDTLIGTMGQRLVRTICAACRASKAPSERQIGWLAQEQGQVWYGQGCSRCEQTGYKGRTALDELFLPLDESGTVAEAIRSPGELMRRGPGAGYYSMAEQGQRAVREGRTTIEEILRVQTPVRLGSGERVS